MIKSNVKKKEVTRRENLARYETIDVIYFVWDVTRTGNCYRADSGWFLQFMPISSQLERDPKDLAMPGRISAIKYFETHISTLETRNTERVHFTIRSS